jgi:hypothetical protein
MLRHQAFIKVRNSSFLGYLSVLLRFHLFTYVFYLVFHLRSHSILIKYQKAFHYCDPFADNVRNSYSCDDALQIYFHEIPDEIIEKLVTIVFFHCNWLLFSHHLMR